MTDQSKPPQPPRRGRPPKLRQCVSCGQMKPRMAFSTATSLACKDCGKNGPSVVPVGPDVPSIILSNTEHTEPLDVALPGKHWKQISEHFMDNATLSVATSQIRKLVPMARCQCCYEIRQVGRDSYGGVAIVCRRCDYQICATGRCWLHSAHPHLWYSELARPEAVPTPPEIEALFDTHSNSAHVELPSADLG